MHFVCSDVDDWDDCGRSAGNFRRTLAALAIDFCQGKTDAVFLANHTVWRVSPTGIENDIFQKESDADKKKKQIQRKYK